MSILHNFIDILLESAPWLVLGLISAGLIKAWVPDTLLNRWMGGKCVGSVVRAALIGAPLPLCSCGVLPAAMGLRRAGASRGATVSFMIATPETGVDSIAISYALLGPFMAIVRPIAAIISAIGAGLTTAYLADERPDSEQGHDQDANLLETEVPSSASTNSEELDGDGTSIPIVPNAGSIPIAPVGKTIPIAQVLPDQKEAGGSSCCSSAPSIPIAPARPAKQEAIGGSCCSTSIPIAPAMPVKQEVSGDSCCSSNTSCCDSDESDQGDTLKEKGWWGRSLYGLHYAFTNILDDLVVWLTIGLVAAALVVTFIPPQSLTSWGSGFPAMIAMLLIGVPMYICATSSTPLAAAMMYAGVSPGAVLVFLLAGPATNMGTLMIVRKEMGGRALFGYLTGIVVIGLFFGWLTDRLAEHFNIVTPIMAGGGADHHATTTPLWLAAFCSVLLVVLAIKPLRRRIGLG